MAELHEYSSLVRTLDSASGYKKAEGRKIALGLSLVLTALTGHWDGRLHLQEYFCIPLGLVLKGWLTSRDVSMPRA